MRQDALTLIKKFSMHCDKAKKFSCLLCGGAIAEKCPRDVDLIIYVETEDLKKSVDEIAHSFTSCGVMNRNIYIKELNMHSIKTDKGNLSLHVVSYNDVLEYVSHVTDPETYTNIDILSFTLNYTTVYRTWIKDTVFLCGERDMAEDLRERISDKIPIDLLHKIFFEKISGMLNYYQEKNFANPISQGILILKLFRELLLYCYAMNKQFYGTAKYIDNDLAYFTEVEDMCDNCKKVFNTLRGETNRLDKELIKNIEQHFCF